MAKIYRYVSGMVFAVGLIPGLAFAQLASAPTQGGVAPVYNTNTGLVPLVGAKTPANSATPVTSAASGGNALPGTIIPLPNPYTTHQGSSAATPPD